MIVGLALSTYSRPADVRFNVRLVREVWPETRHEYRIYLCHNNPKLRDEFEAIRGLDGIVEGKDLPYDSKPRLRCRQVNCWQTGVKAAIDAGCDYAVHFHADAYIVHPEWIDGFIERMIRNRIVAAGRGYGLDHRSSKAQEGDVDDHFFIVSQGIGSEFFDPPGEVVMAAFASEGYLATRMRCAAGERYEHYDDLSKNEHGRIPRAMHPFNWDPERFLLHTPHEDKRLEIMRRVYPDFEG